MLMLGDDTMRAMRLAQLLPVTQILRPGARSEQDLVHLETGWHASPRDAGFRLRIALSTYIKGNRQCSSK